MAGTQKAQKQPMEPPGHILDMLMALYGVTDAEMADAMGMSRQSVNKKRRQITAMTARDVVAFAEVLDVDREVFFGSAPEALVWVAENRPERVSFNPGGGDGDGGEVVKLRPLADVVQWEQPGITTLRDELADAA